LQRVAIHRSRKETDEAAVPQVNPEIDNILKWHGPRIDPDGITCRRT